MPQHSAVAELAHAIDEAIETRGTALATLPGGLTLVRATSPRPPTPVIYATSLCVLAQGSKTVNYGDRTCSYDSGSFMLSRLSTVARSELLRASETEPLLGLALDLDMRVLGGLVNELGDEHLGLEPGGPADALSLHRFDAPLADALARLVRTAGDEQDWRIVGEGAVREVYYRLLTRSAGPLLRARLEHHGALPHVARAIQFIEANLDAPLDVASLAREAGLSVSGLHDKFRKVTAQSPMQFVKGLRLDRARTLILAGTAVTEAAFEVGYASPSQFSREFKRRYGVAPSKALATAGAVQAA